MIIQYNTDKTINGDQRHEEFFKAQIAEGLSRFERHLSRVEVHLKDENGAKEAQNDIHCLMEARIEGRQPIAVSSQADTTKLAVSSAISKLQVSLKKVIDHQKHH